VIPPISPRTVVEAFLPPTGAAPLRDIYASANLAGLADQPVRLAIRRLVAAGEVEQLGRGRAGTLALTDAGRHRLQVDRESLALAAAHDAGRAPWDGRWRLIAVSVPERDRPVRDALRRELGALGAVAVSTGLYVSPHDLLEALHVDGGPYLTTATTSDLVLHGTADPLAIAERLWPRDSTVAAYDAVDDALRHDAADPAASDVVRLLRLADALERAVRHDPLLPAELRAGTWPPSRLRTAWAQRWESIDPDGTSPVYRGWWPPADPTE
jgi:phenylacetic acid degradation operon negative regulatory protein